MPYKTRLERNRERLSSASVDSLFFSLKSLKGFLRPFFLSLNDFKLLNAVCVAGLPPPPGQLPYIASISFLKGYNECFEMVVRRGLARLIAHGYVYMEQGRGTKNRPNTYHLTMAGHELIRDYYLFVEEIGKYRPSNVSGYVGNKQGKK